MSALVVAVACNDVAPTGPQRPEDVGTVSIKGPALDKGGVRNLQLTAVGPTASQRLTAEVRDRTGLLNPRFPVDWATSNPDAFTVDATGLVTARAPGVGFVIATARGTTRSDTLVVIVNFATLRAGTP